MKKTTNVFEQVATLAESIRDRQAAEPKPEVPKTSPQEFVELLAETIAALELAHKNAKHAALIKGEKGERFFRAAHEAATLALDDFVAAWKR